jgi:hypothetical protein
MLDELLDIVSCNGVMPNSSVSKPDGPDLRKARLKCSWVVAVM